MVANTKDASATVSASDNEWTDVETEAQLSFNDIGEEFIGKFLGWSETKTGIVQAHFENAEGAYFCNVGWSLKIQLKKVQVGSLVRLRYESDQDTGEASPMKIFRVQYKNR